MRWCNSTEKEYPPVPSMVQPLEEGRQCHPCNHLFKCIHSLTSAQMWDQLFRMENYSLIVNGYCKDITLLYKVGENRNNTFCSLFLFLRGSFILLYFPSKMKLCQGQYPLIKIMIKQWELMLLINVLLDDSVVIINFSQPSIEYFLEPD